MSKKENLNIALFQQNIVWEDPEANFSKVEKTFADFAPKRSAPDSVTRWLVRLRLPLAQPMTLR